MFSKKEGSTVQLIQLCIGYFFFYVITGVTVKYFLGKPDMGLPGMEGLHFLAYSTLGGTSIALAVVLAFRWFTIDSIKRVQIGPFNIPYEILYIVPSGICTAVVIPTTTLMYTLPISVMVAMVIMRGSVILISRALDAIQIKQGILKKKVYWEENIAAVFAVSAIAANIFFANGKGSFDFLNSTAAVTILTAYICAYALRIYIMNYFKNTRAKGAPTNNKGFFGIEQISAFLAICAGTLIIFNSPTLFGWDIEQINKFREGIITPHAEWIPATFAGMAFGCAAFFSVFLFMFKGRTATFAGLVNRLTSLIAGTTATLVFHYGFGGRFPKTKDWVSLAFILIAVAFLTRAERKRAAALKASHEIEEDGEESIPTRPLTTAPSGSFRR